MTQHESATRPMKGRNYAIHGSDMGKQLNRELVAAVKEYQALRSKSFKAWNMGRYATVSWMIDEKVEVKIKILLLCRIRFAGRMGVR